MIVDILSELESCDDSWERRIYVLPPNDGADTYADGDKSDDEHDG